MIHDDLIKEISKIYPDIVHGKDFLVLMEINFDGTQKSEPWIDRWDYKFPIPEKFKGLV